MERKIALASLRAWMASESIYALIVPSVDPHFSEYPPEYYNVIKFLSGFTGEAGTLVITTSEAALWADSRFFITAEQQLAGSGIALMKIKQPGTPSVAQWLKQSLKAGSTVAIDGNLFSATDAEDLRKQIEGLNLRVIAEDPFQTIWKNRPLLARGPIRLMSEEISGESIASKRERLLQMIDPKDKFVFFISVLDQIMWLCNIRGCDIDYNPLALSYCMVTENGITLFCKASCLEPATVEYLSAQNVTVVDAPEIEQVASYISQYLQQNNQVERICHLGSTSVIFARILSGNGNYAVKNDPVIGGAIPYLRSRKNEVEIQGFRKAFLNDGVAQAKLLKYVYDNVASGQLNEYNVAQKLIEFRSECPDYIGESFEPIVAFNANAASAHYSVTCQADASAITQRGFLLMDTGAHYPYGTTDTTRTIALGPLTASQKEDYTLVLKGMIALTNAIFPRGTVGCQLDILARGPMYSTGKMYYHGTSHGVGHNLCVHEAPQIRMEYSPLTIDEGMVISNEPAIYIDGEYGIRTENVITAVPYLESRFGKFLKFETMTLVPIDKSAIDFTLLNEAEIEWLETYNKNVLETLAPYLDTETAEWLANYIQ